MTILSYKTIFGLTFSAISENFLESFFRKVPKTVILAIFWHVWPKSAKMRIFIKIEPCYFLPLLSPNFMPSFRKIIGAVSEINSLHTSIHTYIHPYKGDPIEPVAFAGSIIVILTPYYLIHHIR